MTRARLPNRRRAVALELVHRDRQFRAHVGFFDDDTPAELFINAEKQNSPLDAFANDGSILLSQLLQRGATLAEIGHSLKRNPDGSPASVIGEAVDALKRIPVILKHSPHA
jgi:hypothetical protein